MLENLWTVAQNVLTLFILIGIGACCHYFHILNHKAVKACADLVLYIATPCVIIKSCIREFDPTMLKGFLIVAAAAVVMHGLLIGAATLIFRDKEVSRRRVLRFALIFSNAGYMALPLQKAVLGDEGVFYCSAYIIVFNIFLFTYGMVEMSGDKKEVSGIKAVLNPGVVGVVVGLILFIFSVPMPTLVTDAIGHMGNLNTPLPMLIVGYYLAQTDFRTAFKDKRLYLLLVLRLIAAPLAALGLLVLCGVRGTLLTSIMICTSTPVATATTMLAARYDCNPLLSVNLVSVTTLCSVITMPLIIAVTNMI